FATDGPPIMHAGVTDNLTHGGTAEDECLENEEACPRGEVGFEAAFQRTTVEQDRLLRQPIEARVLIKRDLDRDLRPLAITRTIDALACLAHESERCRRTRMDGPRQTVATRQPARGVDQYSFTNGCLR